MAKIELREKLQILADAAKYDASCASGGSKNHRAAAGGIGTTEGMGICHSYTPDGRCVSLLKILLTNYCIYDCKFCVNRVTSDVRRARFTVDEVVRLTIDFYKRNYIEGLFLSSGIIQSADYTMEQLIAVARKLREDERYNGYIHLKTIPGASSKLIDEAGLVADRLSVNIELPTVADLKELAPEKNRHEIDGSMDEICVRQTEFEAERKAGFKVARFAPAGQSTQMVVGATATTDSEILNTSQTAYRRFRLRRVYYSAFSPIPHADARLPGKSPPLVREHRLYQADWLLRFYGFEAAELTNPHNANLRLDTDPKTAWALENPQLFPIDLNVADREMLLRVPGLGVRSVERIVQQRHWRKISQSDLRKLRVPLDRVLPFVWTSDSKDFRIIDRAKAKLEQKLAAPVQQLLF